MEVPKWLLCTAYCLLLITPSLSIDEQEPIGDATEETNSKLPSVVQRAVCTVNAGEVKASAEAVTTKTLKGVCGSDEMNLAFRNLEQKLYDELREIKEMLKKLTDVQEEQDSNAIPIVPAASINKPITMKRFRFEQITMKPSLELVVPKKLQPQLKELESASEREEEVDKFNNTMLADQDFKLFTYFWKLENITEHIANASTMSIKSPIFSVRGRTVQLQCTFQHLHRDMIHLQLTLAYPAKAKENNIILDMGGQLKHLKWTEHETWKHKIALLDQSQTHRRTQDLSSQELSRLDMGFSIPNSALLGSNYVRHNSLLVQVILYL